MFKTTTVTQLRSDLAGYLSRLGEGPILVLSRSRRAAVLVEPELFAGLLDRIELLEDLVDGRRAMTDFIADPEAATDADGVFARLDL